jgi:retron-type reverse transcriptase
LVNAGFVEEDGTKRESSLGVPQGGLVSPILSNIYLHEFDLYMEELKSEYNKTFVTKVNPDYSKCEVKIRTARNRYSKSKTDILKAKLLEARKEMMMTTSTVRFGTKIHYVRYADN